MANPGMRHAYKSAKADPVDTTLVGATKWNDRHYFYEDDGSTASGTLGDLLYRGTDGLVTLLTGAQGVLTSAGSGNVAAWSMSPVLTSVKTAAGGLQTLDTNASHYLKFTAGSDLTADHTLTVTTGDADRTITLSGNPTLSDWFDQAVKAASSPTFAGVTVTTITIGAVTLNATEAGFIDGVTAGTAAASKAVVLDASLDTSGMRNLTLTSAGSVAWGSRGSITASADGVFGLLNAAGTSFGRLTFGGTTSSFPAIKRSNANLEARLADDSDYAQLLTKYTYASGGVFFLNTAGTLFIQSGTGSPEGVVSAIVGALFLRTNGGANTTLYVKESGVGNTGWVAK